MPAVLSELWRKTLHTSGARIYGVVLGVVTLSITAHWLGPDGRGEVAAVMTWASMLATLAGFSLGQVALHRASNHHGPGWLDESLSVLLRAAGLLTALAWFVALYLYFAGDGRVFGSVSPLVMALGLALVPTMIWDQYGGALLQAIDRIDIYNRYQVAGRTIAAAAMVMFVVVLNFGATSVVIANLIGGLAISLGVLVFLRRVAGPPTGGRSALLGYFGSGLRLHFNTVGAFLIVSADILMLNYYRGSEETGYYQLGVQILALLAILPQAASMVIYGRIAGDGSGYAWSVHRKLLLQTVSVMLVVGILAGVTAQWWLMAITGPAFTPSLGVFPWQLLALPGMSIAILMGPQWIARGLFWQASALTLFIGCGNVLANWLLIPKYGMYGAVWASIAVYVVAIFGNGAMFLYCDAQAKFHRPELAHG